MDFIIDFISVKNADAIIVWLKKDNIDYVFFIDGGKAANSKDVIDHYNLYIKENVNNPTLIIINSHPHSDHLYGLIEIVDYFGKDISHAVYNDPMKYISNERKQEILDYYGDDQDINHLHEVFNKVKILNDQCQKYNINRLDAFSDLNDKYSGLFRILGPSKKFYKEKVDFFTSVENLNKYDYSKKGNSFVNEEDENLKPCVIVDQENDASPENLTSTIIEFTDSSNKKYLLTADCGIDSFESAEANGFNLNGGFELAQLPHHGSRRNVSAYWLHRISPNYYVVSAEGTTKHPRRAVINCIKRNINNCNVYSTHKSGTLSITTNRAIFPVRGWGNAEGL